MARDGSASVSGDRGRINGFWDRFFIDPQRLILLAGKMSIPNTRFNEEEQALLSWLYNKPFEAITAKEAYSPAHATECARAMQNVKNFWLYTPFEERRRLWKKPDLLSAGELAHKLRFSRGIALGRDELALYALVFERFLRPGETYTLIVKVEDLNGAIEASGSVSVFRSTARLRDPGDIEAAWREADTWFGATEGALGEDRTLASISAERSRALGWLRDANATVA